VLASRQHLSILIDIILYLLTPQNYHTEFLTGTIFNWEHLLINDERGINDFNWLTHLNDY